MDRDTAVAQIISDLKHTGIESTVITDLQLAQTELELEISPWFLIVGVSNLTADITKPDADHIILPTDFQFMTETFAVEVRNTNGVRVGFLKREDEGLIIRARSEISVGSQNGIPTHYDIIVVGGVEVMRIGPLFPATYTELEYEFRYYFKDEVLTGNVENRWLAHAPEVLKSKAGMRTALGLRDVDSVAFFLARLEGDPSRRIKGAMQILREMDEQRKGAGSSPRMRYSGER